MRIAGVRKSVLRPDTWTLLLSCGHDVTVHCKRRPWRRIEPCQICLDKAKAIRPT